MTHLRPSTWGLIVNEPDDVILISLGSASHPHEQSDDSLFSASPLETHLLWRHAGCMLMEKKNQRLKSLFWFVARWTTLWPFTHMREMSEDTFCVSMFAESSEAPRDPNNEPFCCFFLQHNRSTVGCGVTCLQPLAIAKSASDVPWASF